MSRTLVVAKWILPLVVLALGAAGATALLKTGEDVVARKPEPIVPLVRALAVRRGELRLKVESEGTVRPRTESTLVPEVAGVIVSVSPSWADGGFFRAGETLLEIDPSDYRLTLTEADARVAEAELAAAREREEAAVAMREWRSLGGGGDAPPPLVAREPQLAEAEARLAAARAARERARLDLARTRIAAPYAGRVRQKNVDLGQYVSPGSAVARIYSVDAAEVRLPVPDSELAYLDLPLDYRGEGDGASRPEVVLRATFGGKEHEWTGMIVRTEGEIDAQSRMVHAVARVEDPYGRGVDPSRPPLAVGLFVRAEIQGRLLSDVTVLPRHALRDGDRVLVVDETSRLRFRTVETIRTTGSEVIVGDGLAEGERVCVSTLDVVVNGMAVRVADGEGSAR